RGEGITPDKCEVREHSRIDTIGYTKQLGPWLERKYVSGNTRRACRTCGGLVRQVDPQIIDRSPRKRPLEAGDKDIIIRLVATEGSALGIDAPRTLVVIMLGRD